MTEEVKQLWKDLEWYATMACEITHELHRDDLNMHAGNLHHDTVVARRKVLKEEE